MGIPSYYKKIIEEYPDIISSKLNNRDINYLLFDLNCAIHPCCSGKTDEKLMFESIYCKIKECIQLIKPIDIIYLAIDGPAPRTKMEQQRQRRLKSYNEDKIWDTNQITPGTLFMEKLSIYLNSKTSTFGIKTIISDSNEPGEGEHKIMKYIDNLPKEKTYVVYGLDADLIMLSMIRDTNVILLRERTEYNIEKMDNEVEYIFLDISYLKDCLIKSLKKDFYKISDRMILYDYLFICFFIGNDFITNSPSINIRYGGINKLLSIYQQLQEEYFGNYYLLDNHIINRDNLLLFLEKISKKEKEYIGEIIKIRDRQERYIINKIGNHDKQTIKNIKECTPNDLNISNENYEEIINNYPILNRENEADIINNNKYYLHAMFNTINYNPSYDKIIETKKINLCHEYIKSIIWTVNYYFNDCVSWRWYYKYHYAPLITDLYTYLLKCDFNKEIIFNKDKPYLPKEQLEIVLPNQKKTYFYPKDTPVYSFMKRYDWECHPILPH